MRANAEYSGYSTASPVIQWFSEVVQSFSEEDKARLLQFCDWHVKGMLYVDEDVNIDIDIDILYTLLPASS